MKQQVNGFEREIVFTPAFDRRDADPAKNYGIHGVELRFHLRGPAGVVQFVMYTGWDLKHVRQELKNDSLAHMFPMAADLGYHSPVPQYETQTAMPCHLLDGGECYYDGSGLNAIPVMESFFTRGEEAVWEVLEDYYNTRFTTERN